MKRLACILFAVLLGTSAQAAVLELWFSTNSSTVAPPVPEVPVLPVGYSGKVYLWARSAGSFQAVTTQFPDLDPWTYTAWVGDVWQGISLDSVTTIGFNGTIVNTAIGTSLRWMTESDFSWANSDQFNVAAVGTAYRGAGGMLDPVYPATGPSQYDSAQAVVDAFLYTRLGSITITSAPAGATFYMKIGTGTIARRNGDPTNDRVIFGTGDDGIPGTSAGMWSLKPELVIAPEPGSLLLAGLAALALRRR